MEIFKLRNIPNALGVLRVLLCIPIIIFVIRGNAFHIVSIICFIIAGLTDFADGLVARRVNQGESTLGEQIDSIADMVLVATGIFALMPAMTRYVNAEGVQSGLWNWLFYLYAAAISYRMISVIIGVIKFKSSVMLHTYSLKALGWLLFSVPIVFFFAVVVANINPLIVNFFALFVAISVFIIVSEEIAIVLLLIKPSRNIKSIFGIRKENAKIREELAQKQET